VKQYILTAEELDHTRVPSSNLVSSYSDGAVPNPAPSLPESICNLSHSFLLTSPLRNEVTIGELLQHLPIYQRAQNLVDRFYTNAGWFHNPCPREDFLEDIVAQFYPQEYSAIMRKGDTTSTLHNDSGSGPKTSTTSRKRTHSAHDLALLFLVLAFGTQLEVPYATHSEDGEVFQTLSRAALSLEPVANGCSLSLIQVLILMFYRYVSSLLWMIYLYVCVELILTITMPNKNSCGV
jgi:hypothetical protein